MATPTFTLPTSGSDPKVATKEGLEENINQIIQYLDDMRIRGDAAQTTGLSFQGPWDASTELFPSTNLDGDPLVRGDFFWVSVQATFGGKVYLVDEPLVAVVDNPSTTDSDDWYHAPVSPSLVPITDELSELSDRVDGMVIPFSTVSDFFAADITAIQGKANATTGTVYVEVKDGNHRYSLDLAQSVASQYTTSGGVGINLSPNEVGQYHPEALGAVGDGVTDDFVAMQTAINLNKAAGLSGVVWGAKTYFCSEDLYFCHSDANPDYPDDDLLSGRSIYCGAGKMTRRDYANDHYHGSVIKFATGKKAIMSRPQNSVDQNDSARGWSRLVQDMSFVGDNSQIIYDPFMASFSNYERIFVGTETTADGVAVFYVSDNYVCGYTDIEIIGSKDLSENLVGYGFHAEPSDTAGGANRYINITASYFDKPLVFGRTYDGALTSITDASKANFMLNCQGQKCNVGIHFLQNVIAFKVQSCWVESALLAPVKVSHSAENIEFNGCNFVMQGSTLGDRGGIVLGDTTGNAGFDHARNIIIENSRFRSEGGVAGVLVNDAAQDVFVRHNSFLNAGGAAVAIQGGVGGEVTLYGNDYQPTIATSMISTSRRFCILSGTGDTGSDYDDVSYMALDIDYSLPVLVGDLDMSTWRRPAVRVNISSSASDRTVTLPAPNTALRQDCHIRKPFGANDITVDAGTGSTIKGSQTYVLSSAYSHISLTTGSATRWDVMSE